MAITGRQEQLGAAFLRLITGQTSCMALLLTRRLTVRGDLRLARRTGQPFERET
jgi:SCP-2 sterol transfer family